MVMALVIVTAVTMVMAAVPMIVVMVMPVIASEGLRLAVPGLD